MLDNEMFTLKKVWQTTTLVLATALLLLVALAGCAGQAGASQPAPAQSGSQASLAGTEWRLLSFGTPGAEVPVVEETTITLHFNDAGQAGGTAGCNSYGARYEVRESELAFNRLSHTMMACAQEQIAQQEKAFLQALENAHGYALAEERLTIWYDGDQGVLNWIKSD